jgi:hypothetical protein
MIHTESKVQPSQFLFADGEDLEEEQAVAGESVLVDVVRKLKSYLVVDEHHLQHQLEDIASDLCTSKQQANRVS